MQWGEGSGDWRIPVGRPPPPVAPGRKAGQGTAGGGPAGSRAFCASPGVGTRLTGEQLTLLWRQRPPEASHRPEEPRGRAEGAPGSLGEGPAARVRTPPQGEGGQGRAGPRGAHGPSRASRSAPTPAAGSDFNPRQQGTRGAGKAGWTQGEGQSPPERRRGRAPHTTREKDRHVSTSPEPPTCAVLGPSLQTGSRHPRLAA